MLRERDAPMHRFDLGPAVSLEWDPVLSQLDHVRDDDPLVQAVKAD